MKQNRLRPFFSWVLLMILVLTGSTVSAQTELPILDEIWNPAPSDVPPTMSYQPPVEADKLTDFAPADAQVKAIATEEDLKADTAFDETKNNLVTFGDDQIGIFVEEKTFNEDVTLEFTQLEAPQPAVLPGNEESKIPPPPITATNTISNPVVSRDLIRFQLEIVSTAKADVVTEFEKPVRIVLDLRTLVQEQALNPVYGDFYLAYQDEKDPTIWHDVPVTVYQEDGLFSADVLHFSNWAAGVRPQRWNPSWSPPGVSEFSGAATYSYPIELPPGRNGLQPTVSLSYNSRSLDGRIRDGESGPIGDGWSLADIRIVRVGVELKFNGANPYTAHADKFRMTLNGTGYELYPSGTSGVWLVKDSPGIRITRHYDSSLSTDGLFWVVTMADGTQYRLGYTVDSEEWQEVPSGAFIEIIGNPGHTNNNKSAIAWNVDTVTDIFGNQMTYTYNTRTTVESIGYVNTNANPPNWANFNLTTRTSRIYAIKYNYPDRVSGPITSDVDQLTSAPGTRIEFRASSGDTGGTFNKPITSIYIYHGGSANLTKEYRISSGNVAVAAANPYCQNYDVVPSQPLNSNTWTVNSIQEWVNTNSDPADADAGYSLPATTFTYSPLTHYTTGSGNCFSFMYLTGYQNGYGGSVTFSYTSDNRLVGIYQRHEEGTYYWIEWPTIGYNYKVNTVLAYDGRNANPVKTTYAYTQPCYGQWGTPPAGAVNCGVADSPQYGNIVGHATAAQTNYDYNGMTILNKQVTTFSLAANTSIGRPTLVNVYAGSSTLMSETTNNYATETISGLANMFTYTSQTTTKSYSNGDSTPSISSKVTYQYATANQGGVQYGNLTHIKEYDDMSASTPYRETRRSYYPNTTNWLVGLVGVEGIYDGAGALQSGTWYHYDGSNGNASTPPTQGALTRLSKIIPTSCGSVVGCAYARQTIDTYSIYNGYGNLTTTTTYSGYGTRYFNSSWGIIIDNPPATSTARTTNITYETGYNLYPVQVSNPLTHITKFEVYGFKNINGTLIAVDGFQKQPGLLKAVIDPNGVTTTYEYDPFGRLYQIYGQGDSRGDVNDPFDGDPMTRYRYWDNSWNNSGQIWVNPLGNQPFGISVHTRPSVYSSSAPYVMKHLTYFDGFGRPIQEQELSVEVSEVSGRRTIVTTTAYHVLGQASCVSVPYDVADAEATWPNNSFVNTACTSLARTTTAYDGLGRPTTVTAPDGSVSSNTYSIINHITVDSSSLLSKVEMRDANGHGVRQMTNSRGQLVLVRELMGTGTYADTRYSYDLHGNLTMVRTSTPSDTQPTAFLRTVSMSYDNFGRKIGMVDPDMGTWSYSYDATGSLVEQVDAKNQRLCFTYDVLNRLQYKRHDSNSNGCQTSDTQLAYYAYYSSGTGKIGQLSEIRWSSSATNNRETFDYDTMGRLISHTRIIDNRSYTMQTTSFDPLHRPLTVKYPTNEIVTLTYDHEGEQTLMAGTNTLVGNVTYNARGQLMLLDRGGSAPDTTYAYHPQNDAVNGGLGDSNFRLKTIQHGDPGITNAFPDFTYEYDKVGNISKLTTLSTAGTDSQTYTYDDLNRLLTAAATGGVANYSQTYAYDKLGNMTSGPSGTYNYTNWHANCTSPPSQPLPHAVHKIGSYYFCYDNNGNMTTRSDSTGTYTQLFDVENRLTSVTPSGGSATTFAYDANGIRTKTVQPGGITTYFPFPGYEETVNGANTIKRSSYSFAGQTVAMRVSGDPVSGNNGLFYVLSDHLGSTSLLVNSSGGTVPGSTTRNLPYGGYRGSAPTQTITDRGYTGHKQNDTLGLIYMNARYYVPNTNRWLSPDTIVPNPANPQSFNRYSYVRNNPVNLTDPTGHRECGGPYDPACADVPFPENDNLEDIENLQRGNALANTLIAWTGSILSRATILKRVNDLAPVSGGYLNQIEILPLGSFVRTPAPVARVSTAASYGLPLLTGAINQYEIHERLESGLITSSEANREGVANGVFTGVNVGVGGYAIPAAATAVSAPAWGTALVTVSGAYNLTVAQSTVNNMIEGQEFWDALWSARASTNDRFTLGRGQQLEEKLNNAGAFIADVVILAVNALND